MQFHSHRPAAVKQWGLYPSPAQLRQLVTIGRSPLQDARKQKRMRPANHFTILTDQPFFSHPRFNLLRAIAE